MRLGLAIVLAAAVVFSGFSQEFSFPWFGDQVLGDEVFGDQVSEDEVFEDPVSEDFVFEDEASEAPIFEDPVFQAEVYEDRSSEEWYQGRPIRNIVFEGLINVRVSDLEGIIEPYYGQIFNDDTYWDILGRLYALEYFESITPTAIRADLLGSEVIIRFSVVERPVVSRINFVGNRGIRRTELLDTISLKNNDVATQVRLRMDELAIVNKYLERGYPDISVRTETLPGNNSTTIVVFHIEEGERIAIEAFIFEGNTVFSARTLQRQLSLRTKGLIIDGAFQEAKLIADKQSLAQYYRDRGFIDAEVIDDIREIRRDHRGNNLMTITFRIYEGIQYTFGGISFEGNHLFTTEQLSAQVFSKVGETANERRIQADLMRVSDLYFENGYIFNRIEPIPHRDTVSGIISFNVLIVERGRAHIENIIIRGNEKTREWVIRRELPLEPGDVFSKAKVMDGMRNLYNLMYFSVVNPETPPGSVDALMDLVITVEEQPTTDLQFGFTFSGSADPDTFPVSIMTKWNDRNFSGTGNMLGAEVIASPDTQTFSAQYTHRWIFGLPLSGNFDLTFQHMRRRAATDGRRLFHGNETYAYPDPFTSYDDYAAANKIPPDSYLMPYNQWRISLGVGTGYRWTTAAGILGVGGGFRVGMILNTFDNNTYRPFDPVLRDRNNSWTPATSVWTSVSLDNRDIYFDPSRGYYLIQRIGWYGFLRIEPEHYIRTDTKAEWFYTLFDIPVSDNWSFKAVFGIHTGLSFIFRQPHYDEPRIEDASRLSVDGMFIGRGWISEFRHKGHALWNNWAEIRIPLAPGILAWDFFFDAAGIKDDFYALFTEFSKPDDRDYFFMRFSFGGGFRFTIPQFPFRFSLAKRFLIRGDGSFEWVTGGIGGSKPGRGIDFVVSFALSTY